MVFLVSLQKEICILTKVVLAQCIDFSLLFFLFFPMVLRCLQKLVVVSHAFTVKSSVRDIFPVTLDGNSWQCFARDLFIYSWKHQEVLH